MEIASCLLLIFLLCVPTCVCCYLIIRDKMELREIEIISKNIERQKKECQELEKKIRGANHLHTKMSELITTSI